MLSELIGVNPMGQEATDTAIDLSVLPVSPDKLRVLVVDDDVDTRVLVKTMLSEFGFTRVTAVEDAATALSRIQRGLTDFVFVDLRLPKLPGIELIRIIRASDKLLPMVILTSDTDREAVIDAFKAGANDFIAKPFTADLLVQKVIDAMAARQERKVHEESEER